ncbi:Oxidoreductase family, NAD-binding Rossmann fold [Cyclobacterium lianum]|uniref:Oxidoreductase family, NAD-binding Rossmann fold n=1 Tax=Cyclobacterium lianum TaxID=388280 RepID=A0A1M7L9C8_9BACT|nr:Gfo/Idh/MocA family oxidoreductase [Cyclobacterium lianum]SHM74526.1 Oxidoreductase family, NAD-binding Rossmann fold [Cyclobacterium lianum]
MKNNQRRSFLKKSALVASSIFIVPSHVVSGLGHVAPSDKLNIAGIGVGGKGRPNLNAMRSENIVALCDVDRVYAQPCFNDFPQAKKFEDWREMFDRMGKDIDAVMVATPDHTHAMIAATALQLDKHVYCQKPLTHSIYESRLLTRLAAEHQVATQMGNQGNSGIDAREVIEWIQNGEIGEVREVHAWTDRPIWPQGLERPQTKMSIPEGLNWDLFLGPAPYRPFHEVYTPWNWRGWWDFGTGAFGDMACHVLDPVYTALNLGYPTQIEGSSSPMNIDSAPQSEKVRFRFPARSALEKVNLPQVDVYWYDGGLLPYRPEGLPAGVDLMADGLGGCIFVGSKDTLYCGSGGVGRRLLSGREPAVSPRLRRIPEAKGYKDGPHEQDWIRACKESPESRTPSSANFNYAGPFNEMVLLGVLAIRLQSLHKTLHWDGASMQFTNISASDQIRVKVSDGFTRIDGKPRFNSQFAELNAAETVAEYIRHSYREGWSLPG